MQPREAEPPLIQALRTSATYFSQKRDSPPTSETAGEVATALSSILRRTPDSLLRVMLEGYSLLRQLKPQRGERLFSITDSEYRVAVWSILSFLRTSDPRIPRRFLEGQLLKPGTLSGKPMASYQKRMEKEKELGVKIPWALVIEVTTSCNLTPPCEGCSTAEYPKVNDPSTEALSQLVTEAELLGIGAIVFSGGEPLSRESDLLQVIENHPHLNYAVFTNGTLIGENTAERFLETGANCVFFTHIQGPSEVTDEYMGKGVFDRITYGMDLLKKKGFPFGFSITITKRNFDQVTAEEFTDYLLNKGCRFGIYFP